MRKLFAAAILAVLAGVAGAQAQTYPSRPITLVVPFPPGGSTDVAARIMAERMRASLGQPVIVENIRGAARTHPVRPAARPAPAPPPPPPPPPAPPPARPPPPPPHLPPHLLS